MIGRSINKLDKGAIVFMLLKNGIVKDSQIAVLD